jgi:anti-sigma B factor antagonist
VSYTLDVSRVGDAHVARLQGEVDLANAAAVEAELSGTAAASTLLVVDLSGVDYVDSTGFGVLERLAPRTALRVVLPSTATIHRAFRVTGLSQLVPVFESLDDALAG